jgi:hypothetical protein
VSFAAINLCVSSQRVFIVVYFVIDTIRTFLHTPSYTHTHTHTSRFPAADQQNTSRQPLMMDPETVSEKLEIHSVLTQLVNWGSSASIVIRLWRDDRGLNSCRGRDFFPSPPRPNRISGPQNLLSN